MEQIKVVGEGKPAGEPEEPMTDVTTVTTGDVRITARDPARDAAQRILGRLWIDRVPVRLASDDPTLWGLPAGAARCWPAAPGSTRALLPRIAEATDRVKTAGLTDVVLVGRGAPAMAAKVVARHAKAPLIVLDGLDPAPTLRLGADPDRLRRTVVVVAGEDVAATSQAGLIRRLFRDIGLDQDDAAERFVVAADVIAGESNAAESAWEWRRITPHGGDVLETAGFVTPYSGVFGALSPYALLPVALAGVNISDVLDQATAVLPSLTRPENNPGLVLGAILAGSARAGRNKVIIGGFGSRYDGLDEWAGRLLTGATGAPRTGARFAGGMVPVVQLGGLPLAPSAELFLVALDGRPHQDDATVTGSLGAQFVVWEYAAAVAAYLMGADPFAPRPPLTDTVERTMAPLFRDRDVDGFVEHDSKIDAFGRSSGLAAGTDSVAQVLDRLLDALPGDGHLAILAYLDPDPFVGQGRTVRRLAGALGARAGRPVTVCWDPDPPVQGAADERGVYLVLTGKVMDDYRVLDEGDRLSRLQLAQALATTSRLRELGRPVARLHLHHRWTGIAQLLDAAHQGGRA